VQDLTDKNDAAVMLGKIRKNIFVLRDYLINNIGAYKEYKPYIEQFNERINDVNIIENSINSSYTSYTVNKGDEIALCLRSKYSNAIHDINLLMYVVIHELAHVACPEQNHTELFKDIFRFLLGVSSNIGIYNVVAYDIDPHEYCGLTIYENILK
jgi:hypothetical protein